MTSAKHSKATNRWGTPREYIERARRVMGGIDLDPCTEDVFEVGAMKNYSLLDRGEDGLILPWSGRVFANPPGGLVREFWRRLMSQDVQCAIWIGFSVEQLCLLADEEFHPADFCLCLLRQRIPFIRHDGYKGSPAHSNYVTYIGSDCAAFEREFGLRGRTIYGRCT